MKTSLIWLFGLAVVASLCLTTSATPVPETEIAEKDPLEESVPEAPVDEAALEEDDDDESRSIGSTIAQKITKGTGKFIKKIVMQGGKKVVKLVKVGTKKVVKGAGKLIKEGGKKVIKGATKVVKEGGKKVIKVAGKVVKEGGKKVIKGASKVIKEGGKKVVKVIKSKGGKMVIKGIKKAAKVAAEVGADLAMEMALEALLSGGEGSGEEVEYEYEEEVDESEVGEGDVVEEVVEEEEGEEEVEEEGEGDEEEEEDDEVDLITYVNSNEHCKCTGNKKCECCVTVPEYKEACLIVTVLKSLWEPDSEVRLATSYGDEKALTVKFPGTEKNRCTTLPESMGSTKMCMFSEGKKEKKGVQTQCFKFTFNNEETFTKCLLETKEKIALRAM